MKKSLSYFLKSLLGLILVNVIFSLSSVRLDLTEDRRYTLSEKSLGLTEEFISPVVIDVLLDGDLPTEFVKLQTEVVQLLRAFKARNNIIEINLVDPLEDVDQPELVITELQGLGLIPANVTTEENNRLSQEIVFPWAIITYQNSSEKVNLLKNKLGATQAERINNSVQNLEYAFANAFSNLLTKDRKKIAVIKGNGELEDIHIADLLSSLNKKYAIGKITLDSVEVSPNNTLRELLEFDLALIAKPTIPFSEKEKLVLDQYMVNGGKTIWLLDNVAIEMDSLFNTKGESLALRRELNLDDLLFRYGLRVNADLVKDLICSQIVLAAGEASNTQYNPVPWYYYPMVFANDLHPLTTNMEAVRFQFANSIDTLANPYKKTILYSSSLNSAKEGIPRVISLEQLNQAPIADNYSEGNIPLAVMVEGSFSSAFKNRVLPFNLNDFTESGDFNKMVVISDGDFIRNQLRNGRPLELGYDKWTNNYFGNKEFVINTIDYLLGNEGLINMRNKRIKIPVLDQSAIQDNRLKWQIINIGVPLVILLIFGFIYNYIRKKRYSE